MRLQTIQIVAGLVAAVAFILAFMAAGAALVSGLFMLAGLAAGSLAGHYDPANLDAVVDDWDEVLAIDRDDLDVLIREVLKRGSNAPV
mgnify:CR=1 FL=1